MHFLALLHYEPISKGKSNNSLNNPEKAQELGREKKNLENIVLVLTELQQSIKDSQDLFELASSDNDDETLFDIS